jgi:prophage antirepressor-like protein
MIQDFNGIQIDVTPTHNDKQWFMTVEEVAKGYGASPVTIRRHLSEHDDEIREGIERGVQNLNTLGGPQRITVLYRIGVVRLGSFIRSPQAKIFREWAANLVVAHMDQTGMTVQEMFSMINRRFDEERDERRQEIADIRGIVGDQQATIVHHENRIEILEATLQVSVRDRDRAEIEQLMEEASAKTGWSGTKVAGHVRATLGTSGVYIAPNLNQVKNVLRNLIGRGVTGVLKGGSKDKP